MGNIKVRNIRGTSDRTPPRGYSSWLDFWERKMNKEAVYCKVNQCSERAEVGAHVIISGDGSKEYILPMCKEHSNLSPEIEFTTNSKHLVLVHKINIY